ncbi:calcium-binding protein [Kribbella yunnanensis]|uniref:calcium-binding protein n=1 Tax=Kribbella yunnanensis TaxID=190194 RepID=UPI003CD09183
MTGQGGAGTGAPTTTYLSLAGDAGDDTLTGGNFGDALAGGPGNDTLNGAGHAGTSWGDAASYFAATGPVSVNLANHTGGGATEGTDTLIGIESVDGSDHFGDTLIGDGNANHLIGRGGSDTLKAAGGADLLTGGRGVDSMEGGTDADIVSFYGEPDAVEVDLGFQKASTFDGSETFLSIEGAIGTAYADTLTGTNGPNYLAGAEGVDAILGLGGDDRMSGGGGNDALSGGAGNDSILPDDQGPVGNDVAHGGTGVDTVNYSTAPTGVVVNLSTGTTSGGAGSDSVPGFENVIGSQHDDLLTGDGKPNVLQGLDGKDSLNGRSGDDTLLGGPGVDALNGGPNTDSCDGGGQPGDTSDECE